MACTSGSRSVTYHRWIVMMSCPQWLLLPRVQEHDPQQLGLDHCLGQTCIGSRSSHRLQPEWLDKNKFISLKIIPYFLFRIANLRNCVQLNEILLLKMWLRKDDEFYYLAKVTNRIQHWLQPRGLTNVERALNNGSQVLITNSIWISFIH